MVKDEVETEQVEVSAGEIASFVPAVEGTSFYRIFFSNLKSISMLCNCVDFNQGTRC